jgi:hypothetical protein
MCSFDGASQGASVDAVVHRLDDLAADQWNDPVRGTLQFRVLLDSAVTHTGVLSAGVAKLSTDGWLGLHRHPQAETYHIIEGDGLLVVTATQHRGRSCPRSSYPATRLTAYATSTRRGSASSTPSPSTPSPMCNTTGCST